MDKQLIEQTWDLLNQIKQLHGSKNIVILSAGGDEFVMDSNDDMALSYAMIISAADEVIDQLGITKP